MHPSSSPHPSRHICAQQTRAGVTRNTLAGSVRTETWRRSSVTGTPYEARVPSTSQCRRVRGALAVRRAARQSDVGSLEEGDGSVARWEKEFCEANGVPWKKVTDPSAGLNGEGPGGRVACWDDSGAVHALLAAKKRYWAEINGGISTAPPLPDPNMYIDVVVDDEDDGGVEEEEKGRYAEAVEAEYAAAVRDMERAREEGRRMRAAAMRDDFVPVPTGWDA
ncbi:hypothetical protein EJB05_35272, partial [Eragrostis curvula]